ncbi:LytTR family DNA-binding domain-containing protein [Algoriphagus sp. SE2]|uniref:LytR/AlgR family response regulator transcription factor n=1 Tax=Algoriphagus sp. SE2 TaxID=3141536 RepID=UPI0031CD8568
MMKILIIEDEIPASELLIASLKAHDASIEILGILDSNQAIVSWFKKSNILPDLIFSDIELLDGVVFNSLIQLNIQVPIIFTTAYQDFTMEAFETSGIAYLLKPIAPQALQKALLKYEQLTKTNIASLKTLLDQLNIGSHNTFKSRFSVKIGQGIYLLNTVDITCMRMKNGVLHAYKRNGKSFILSSTLNDTYDQIDPRNFFLLNRSDLVQIDFIEKVEPYFNDRLAVFVSGQKDALITSAAKTSEFRKWLEKA